MRRDYFDPSPTSGHLSSGTPDAVWKVQHCPSDYQWVRITAITVFLALLSSPVVARAPLPDECDGEARAYVLIGDDSGFLNEGYATSSADEAESDFDDAGYTVVRDNTATRQHVVDALNDPCVRAIWIFGHGKYETKKGKLGKEKLANPVEGIDMDSGTVIWGPSQGANVPANDCLIEVTFHSCGQNLQSWREHFPGSTFNAWSSTTRGWQIYWWQFFHEYPEVADGQTKGASLFFPPPIVESRQEHSGQVVFEPDLGVFRCEGDSQANCWQLTPQLTLDFGEKSFNLVVTDDGLGSRQVVVLSAQAQQGRVVSWDLGVQSPDFMVQMTTQAVRNVLMNGDVYPDEVALGHIQVTANGTSQSEDLLLEGFGGLIFGWNAQLCEVSVLEIPALSPQGLAVLVILITVAGLLVIFQSRSCVN